MVTSVETVIILKVVMVTMMIVQLMSVVRRIPVVISLYKKVQISARNK